MPSKVPAGTGLVAAERSAWLRRSSARRPSARAGQACGLRRPAAPRSRDAHPEQRGLVRARSLARATRPERVGAAVERGSARGVLAASPGQAPAWGRSRAAIGGPHPSKRGLGIGRALRAARGSRRCSGRPAASGRADARRARRVAPAAAVSTTMAALPKSTRTRPVSARHWAPTRTRRRRARRRPRRCRRCAARCRPSAAKSGSGATPCLAHDPVAARALPDGQRGLAQGAHELQSQSRRFTLCESESRPRLRRRPPIIAALALLRYGFAAPGAAMATRAAQDDDTALDTANRTRSASAQVGQAVSAPALRSAGSSGRIPSTPRSTKSAVKRWKLSARFSTSRVVEALRLDLRAHVDLELVWAHHPLAACAESATARGRTAAPPECRCRAPS